MATIRDRLQEAADNELGDYLSFRIGEPKHEFTNAPKGGARFPCEVVLVGKVYARFHIDVGCGDALVGEPDRLVGDDLLSFAGIGPAFVRAIPKAQQFAEKLHAYTFPWSGRHNTRTKDLVDLVLLIERGPLEVADVGGSLEATFSTRSTHPLPKTLPHPPREWATEFMGMARSRLVMNRCRFEWKSPCHRPGCYEVFRLPDEHSCKRFCSIACRLALRRVLDREARYRARRRRRRRERVTKPARPPDSS